MYHLHCANNYYVEFYKRYSNRVYHNFFSRLRYVERKKFLSTTTLWNSNDENRFPNILSRLRASKSSFLPQIFWEVFLNRRSRNFNSFILYNDHLPGEHGEQHSMGA